MRNHNLIFIDIETTGLVVGKHEIIEIGFVLVTPDLEVIEEFEAKVRPEDIEKADPVSLKINGYDPKNWRDAIDLKEAMQLLSRKASGSIMVGHNVSFDSSFIENAFAKVGIKNPMHYHKLDTVSMSWAKLHRNPDLEHFSLYEMCERFGIKNKNAHTALSDARATYELYKKLMSL